MEKADLKVESKIENRDPTVRIRLIGPNIKPESIPVSTMAQLVTAVQNLAGGSLRLAKVHRTSAAYLMHTPDVSVVSGNLQKTGLALDKPEDNLESSMLESLDELQEIIARLHCKLEVTDIAKNQWQWTLEATQWPDIKSNYLVTDETSMFGTLMRIGGSVETKCALRVPFHHRQLICYLANTDLARRLGPHLYQDIVVRGRGLYFCKDWRLLKFTVDSFDVKEYRSYEESYKAMRNIVGKEIDAISDVESFVKDLR